VETPPVQVDKINMIKLILYLGIVSLIGAVIGVTLIYVIKSQKPVVVVVESSTNESAERYLNPIDRDPVRGIRYKVPSEEDTIKVYTGEEEDSPIDGFIRKRKRPATIVKCDCGKYNCDGICRPDCNCTGSKGKLYEKYPRH